MAQKRAPRIPPDDRRCTARVKTCKKCGYRFPKDKSTKCAQCGHPRRCVNWRYKDKTVCAIHGGKGGTPPGMVGENSKIRVAQRILSAYNRILAHPSLLSLAQEIAIANAHSEQLQTMIEDNDVTGAHENILKALNTIERGMIAHDKKLQAYGLDLMHIAIDPIRVEGVLWYRWQQNTELQRRLVETERKYLEADKQNVPISEVLEALIIVQRAAFKYIPHAQDRAAYANELRAMIPSATPPAQSII